MVTTSQRLTWEGLFQQFKAKFAYLTGSNTEDRRMVWKVQHAYPSPDKTLDCFYPFALVEIRIQNRSWRNCWRGSQYANTWFELLTPDWGDGHEVNVAPKCANEVTSKLTEIEEDFGCCFVVKTAP